MENLVGTKATDVLRGTADADFIAGEGGADRLVGRAGDDVMLGGGGDDKMYGQAGNDTMFGNSSAGGAVDMEKFRIGQDVSAKVTFQGETAGYKNALGVYKIADDGTIYDVQMLFSNASLKGSGGNLVSGESAVGLDLKEGDKLGFFVVPNGYSQKGMAALLEDTKGKFSFVDSEGNPGNVNGKSELVLVHTSAEGMDSKVTSQYGTSTFHSVMGENGAMNADGLKHVTAEVDTQSGKVKIGFEDLMKGGDKDFDDSVFEIDLGVTNAALLPRPAGSGNPATDNDLMVGGRGDDAMFGMRGDDVMKGGAGDDKMYGNSGNDDMRGGAGNDDMRGGSGDDVMRGGAGNDVMQGNTGNDQMFGGAGNDVINGNSGNDVIADGGGHDTVSGGSGDDVFIAGAGRDSYDGGSGFDTIDYSAAKRGITMDMSKHEAVGLGRDTIKSVEGVIGSSHDDTIKGDKRDNVIDGGAGDDMIRGLGGSDTMSGGNGRDTFAWLAKDVMLDGQHLGVDTITDFSFEDGDVLDLSKMIDGSPSSLADLVMLTENDSGTMVSILLGKDMVDVVQLDGVHGADVDHMLADGMILA